MKTTKTTAKKAAKSEAKSDAAVKKHADAGNTSVKEPKAEKKSDGLRAPQVRILKALAAGKALTRKELAEAAPVDQASCTEHIGSQDAAKRKANDAKHWPSLISLGLVAAEEKDAVVLYSITAAGRKALKTAGGA